MLLPDESGTNRLGSNVKILNINQGREYLNPWTTLRSALTGDDWEMVLVNKKPRHVVGYMKEILFSPIQLDTPIGNLSGGERSRLILARGLAQPTNLMVLDEPTNDLDLETLGLLQELLADYNGTLLLISHDPGFFFWTAW